MVQPGRYQIALPANENIGKLSYRIDVFDYHGRFVSYPGNGANEQCASLVFTNDFEAPSVQHGPIKSFSPEAPLVIRARVTDTSGVKSVQLKYRGISQHIDYSSAVLIPVSDGWFEAKIPSSQLPKKWDLMYYFEVYDNQGNSAMYPSFKKQTPYSIAHMMH